MAPKWNVKRIVPKQENARNPVLMAPKWNVKFWSVDEDGKKGKSINGSKVECKVISRTKPIFMILAY